MALHSAVMSRLPILIVLLLVAACASPDSQEVPASTATSDPAAASSTAPTPFTAAEIRDWNPTGTRLVFRIEDVGRPPVLQTILFVDGDQNRAVMEASIKTEDGVLIEEADRTERTWVELRDHAAFPVERTKRDAVTVDVPIGRLACWLYTVTSTENGVVTTRTFYFAKRRPGPPVRAETLVDGELVSRMDMIEDSRIAASR